MRLTQAKSMRDPAHHLHPPALPTFHGSLDHCSLPANPLVHTIFGPNAINPFTPFLFCHYSFAHLYPCRLILLIPLTEPREITGPLKELVLGM